MFESHPGTLDGSLVADTPRGRRLLGAHELAQTGRAEGDPLPLDLIDPDPRNPRAKLVEIDALAESIKDFGLLQAVLVRPVGERFQVVAGHRRLAAYAKLREMEPLDPRWRAIPAAIRTMDDDRAYLALITAQAHSAQWKPREQAAALEVLALGGLTLREIGERLHRTESWASKRLRVFSDAVLSGYVQTGRLSPGVADVIVSVRDPDERRALADRAAAESWTQDQAQAEVRRRTLDVQVRDLGRRARELVDLLSQVEGRAIGVEVFRDLWTLHGRVEVLASQARGAQPHVPTIEEAERAAGVTEAAKARAEARRVETARRARAAQRAQRRPR